MGYFINQKTEKNIKILKNKIDALDRVSLINLPTPLQKMSNLQKALNGPQIYIKRDDLTGFGFGGNKSRMLEFTLAKAIKTGADCVIGTAAIQSNYCRQLSAAGAKLGLDVFLVLRKMEGENSEFQGNYLLNHLYGAKITLLETDTWEKQNEMVFEIEKKLIQEGRKPYIMRATNSKDLWIDTVSYVNCGIELIQQFDEMKIKPNYFFLTSVDTTQAGLLVVKDYLDLDIKIIGISPTNKQYYPDYSKKRIIEIARKTASKLGIDIDLDNEEIISIEDYIGEGYGCMNDSELEAIKLLASTEAIILDPVYSGKGFWGLVDYIKKEKLSNDDVVVFLHTGGTPTIFSYAKQIAQSYQIKN